jgi:hypothetical protein
MKKVGTGLVHCEAFVRLPQDAQDRIMAGLIIGEASRQLRAKKKKNMTKEANSGKKEN